MATETMVREGQTAQAAAPPPAPAALSPKPSIAGDVWGGLAAALVALPASIAYGVVTYSPLGAAFAGYGALAGVLGAAAMGMFAPALGGAPRLISAPCAPSAAVMGALAAQLVAGASPTTPEQALLLMTVVGLASGALQLLYGAVRGGKLIKYIPYPVVSGYLSGVGITIFISQIPKLLEYPKGMAMWQALQSPGTWEWPGVVVGLVTMAVMVLTPKVTRKVPGSIVGLVAGIAAYFLLSLHEPELRVLAGNKLLIGTIGGGAGFWESFTARWGGLGGLRLSDLLALAAPALTLSVLLSVDTLKTCVVLDAMTRSRHNSNRELLGQGVGNLVSAACGGMPGSGTSGSTMVNLSSGGATRLSGILEGAFVLAFFVLAAPLISWLPLGALAGILMVVGVRMVDPGVLHLLRQKETLLDFVVIVAVIGTAIGVSLIAASGVGLGLSILLFIRDQIRGNVIRRKLYGDRVHSKQRRLPAETKALEEHGSSIVVCELQGNLFFGTTDQLMSQLEADLKRCRYVILDMRRVQSVDFTGAHILEQIHAMMEEKGGELLFADLPAALPTGQDLKKYFSDLGVFKTDEALIFGEQSDALEWAENKVLEEANARSAVVERALELAEMELLKGTSADSLAELQGIVRERAYEAGQAVCRQGDQADEIFFIRRGAVKVVLRLSQDKTLHLATFTQGDVFGDLAFLLPGVRTADVVAEGHTELFILPRRNFDSFAAQHLKTSNRVFMRLAEMLAARLRHADAELSALRDS